MTRRRRYRNRRGRAALETAITLSLLMMMLLGVVDYARLIMMRHLMDNAAREGARYAVVSTAGTSGGSTVTTAQVQSQVTTYLAGQVVSNLNVQVYQADLITGAAIAGTTWNSSAFGKNIAVQIDLDFQPISPAIMPNALHMRAKSMMRSEAN
jgi:Flp pilus assembly protein TadG